MAAKDKKERWYFAKEDFKCTPSRKSGIDEDKELSYRQQAANFIQDMGQRLQVTQLCINTAIVYMHRFYMFHSFHQFHRNAIAACSLFLAAKVEEQPRKLEHVIKVAHYCLHRDQPPLDSDSDAFREQAEGLIINENILLQTLGFDIAIDHPHTHVVRCCQLVKASKDLAQTSYFMATNSLHLTTMCLQHKPTVVACVCILLACKWSNWEIPASREGRDWWWYVDKTTSYELLQELTTEFLNIFNKCPSRLRKKISSCAKEKPYGDTDFGGGLTENRYGGSNATFSLDSSQRLHELKVPSEDGSEEAKSDKTKVENNKEYKDKREKFEKMKMPQVIRNKEAPPSHLFPKPNPETKIRPTMSGMLNTSGSGVVVSSIQSAKPFAHGGTDNSKSVKVPHLEVQKPKDPNAPHHHHHHHHHHHSAANRTDNKHHHSHHGHKYKVADAEVWQKSKPLSKTDNDKKVPVLTTSSHSAVPSQHHDSESYLHVNSQKNKSPVLVENKPSLLVTSLSATTPVSPKYKERHKDKSALEQDNLLKTREFSKDKYSSNVRVKEEVDSSHVSFVPSLNANNEVTSSQWSHIAKSESVSPITKVTDDTGISQCLSSKVSSNNQNNMACRSDTRPASDTHESFHSLFGTPTPPKATVHSPVNLHDDLTSSMISQYSKFPQRTTDTCSNNIHSDVSQSVNTAQCRNRDINLLKECIQTSESLIEAANTSSASSKAVKAFHSSQQNGPCDVSQSELKVKVEPASPSDKNTGVNSDASLLKKLKVEVHEDFPAIKTEKERHKVEKKKKKEKHKDKDKDKHKHKKKDKEKSDKSHKHEKHKHDRHKINHADSANTSSSVLADSQSETSEFKITIPKDKITSDYNRSPTSVNQIDGGLKMKIKIKSGSTESSPVSHIGDPINHVSHIASDSAGLKLKIRKSGVGKERKKEKRQHSPDEKVPPAKMSKSDCMLRSDKLDPAPPSQMKAKKGDSWLR